MTVKALEEYSLEAWEEVVVPRDMGLCSSRNAPQNWMRQFALHWALDGSARKDKIERQNPQSCSCEISLEIGVFRVEAVGVLCPEHT